MQCRRSFLTGGAASILAAGDARSAVLSAAIPPSGRLDFRIMRKGSQIGHHVGTFAVDGDLMTMRAEAEIVVSLLGVALFRYTHSVVERWQAGRFMALDTRTNDDGTPYTVSVRREASGLAVSGSAQPRYIAPADALPMTHWNRAEIDAAKINPQKGDLLRPVVTDKGVAPVRSAAGDVKAHHYRFDGQAMLDVWFDEQDRWAALAFLGSDQSVITLERQ